MTRPYAVRAPFAVRAPVTVAALTLLAGCSQGSAGTTGTPQDPPARTLTVLAAASLQRSFERIGSDFEGDHPGVTVRFGFGGSSGLVAQLADGAPADVLATANEPTMDTAVAEGLVAGEPTPFASNRLQIVVPKDNPAGIRSLGDLADPGAKVVLCAPAVPCGAASVAVEQAAGIDIRPVSEEQSVTDVLGKVRSGEADAGLVYVTDVAGAGDEVAGLDVAEAASARSTYPIATLTRADDAALAEEFVAAVTGAEGQSVLQAAGFAAP
ncbi:molybdate ABC transporter substrate-binding protein [Knoellia aerolata]|uniref:Molybdate-binding protein n=1 Tax=Knoellia aerolata DSM 18566 TaxID=1385519 RepID=A0A0A0JYB7_9MICO|nr:molybdate ABC transporter substrate-binding protein [Knoellia aerolata]KGN42455.1 molybdate-binding protein [Knoellia aerolata DSM 18566]